MTIPKDLEEKFYDVIEISNLSWDFVDKVAVSDTNVLRPIKGVCFEELFRNIATKYMPNAGFKLGPGDSDVDVYLNEIRLQLKTIDKGASKKNQTIGEKN